MKRALLALLLASAAAAAPPREDEAVQALRRTQAAQARSSARAASLTTQHDRTAAAAARAERQAALLARQVGEAQAAVQAARRRAEEARAAEQAQAAEIARTRAPLAGMVAALARIARRPPALALANGASLSEAAHLRILIRYMRGRIATQNAALTEELGRRTALREETARAVAALDASRRLLGQRRQLLARSQADLAERSAILADAAETERERLRGLTEESALLGSALSDSQRDDALSDRLAALPGPVLRPSATPKRRTAAGTALYRLPSFGRLVAGTGESEGDGVRARGITLATAPGLAVLAPGAGRILYAGPFRNYGDIVILDHGHGWTSLVAGMARTSTELGADLFQGAVIGRSGRRLLIELRHNGRPVDIVAMAVALRR